MLRKIIFATLALGALMTASVALAQDVGAPAGSSTDSVAPLPVTYPIAELGGCTSKDACRVYCDVDANHDACFAYAQTHGLMRQDEIAKAREYLKAHVSSSTPPRLPPPNNASSSIDAILAAGGGPGGCTTRDECRTFCDDSANSAACLTFAQNNKLMTPAEIALAKKLQTQVGPGGCQGDECKNYCQDSSHEEVCVAFAQQNGFISKDDADQRLQKMRLSSTTPELPPIHVDGDNRVSSSTSPSGPKPGDNHPGTTTRNVFKEAPPRPAGDGDHASSTAQPFRDLPKDTPPPTTPPPPPPHQDEGSSTGQSSSIFFSILHFFGL